MGNSNRIQAHYDAQEGKSIIEIIKDKLLLDFLGKKNAKKRRVLLSYATRFDKAITDRKMRRIYNAILPVHWCGGGNKRGIYVPDDPEEVRKAIRTRVNIMASHQRVIDVILEPHLERLIKRKKEETVQIERAEQKMRGQQGLFQ